MNANHTPGPWEATAGSIYHENSNKTWTFIASVAPQNGRENAQLISAAPTMLEALQFIERFEKLTPKAREFARAAISKALDVTGKPVSPFNHAEQTGPYWKSGK